MKILMVGANGKFASLVLPELKKHGATVRALIRNADGEAEARRQGADEVAIGDLADEASLRRAASGADGVFHINPAFAPNEADLGVSMVHAATQAGVKKFTFSGVIHPSISKMSNHASKRPVEEALYESGLTFTVLQPAMFMQNLATAWQEVKQKKTLSYPYSKLAKACYVDYRDVAEAAAIALTSHRLDYGTFELSSPGMLNRVELAQWMSQAIGYTVEAKEPAFGEWAQQANIPEGALRDGLKIMYDDYDKFGFPGGNALVLEAILGRKPRSLRAFVEELAGKTSDKVLV